MRPPVEFMPPPRERNVEPAAPFAGRAAGVSEEPRRRRKKSADGPAPFTVMLAQAAAPLPFVAVRKEAPPHTLAPPAPPPTDARKATRTAEPPPPRFARVERDAVPHFPAGGKGVAHFEVSTPSPAPLPVTSFVDADPSLRLQVWTHGARLDLSSGLAEELALHLRVRDGVAFLRAEGPAAHALDLKAPELVRALETRGLALGSAEPFVPSGSTGEPGAAPSGRGGHEGQALPEPPPPASARRTAASARRHRQTEGHIHVEA